MSQPARWPCSAADGVTGQVCNWIDEIRLESVPLSIQSKVKHLILDGVACLIIGSKLPWSKIAVRGVLDIEGEAGSCSLFGWDKVCKFRLHELRGDFSKYRRLRENTRV